MKEYKNIKIRLSFSGGGFRATFFCLGAFRRLVELGLWNKVCAIDSVSGGSIAAGVIMNALTDGPFKNLEDFDIKVSKPLKQLGQSRLRELITLPMFLLFTLGLLVVIFLTLFIFRFSIIPSTIYVLLLFTIQPRRVFSVNLKRQMDRFFNGKRMSDLPSYPEWSIHATCLNTAKRFRFKQDNFGGNLVGVTKDSPSIKMAFAVACSAAFPQVFVPLKLALGKRQFFFNWWTDKPRLNKNPPKKIFLSDGGVYDNLGSESIIRDKHPFIILDAGGYISQWSLDLNPNWLVKTGRILNTALDQIISLRRRLIYQRAKTNNGVTLILGEPVRSLLDKKKSEDFGQLSDSESKELPNYCLFDDDTDRLIADLRTDLDAFHDIEIDMLMWAGAVRMDIIIKKFLKDLLTNEQFNDVPKKPEFSNEKTNRILTKGGKISILGFLHKNLTN